MCGSPMPEVPRTVDIAAIGLGIAYDVRSRGLEGEERNDRVDLLALHANTESIVTLDRIRRFADYVLEHIDGLEKLQSLKIEE